MTYRPEFYFAKGLGKPGHQPQFLEGHLPELTASAVMVHNQEFFMGPDGFLYEMGYRVGSGQCRSAIRRYDLYSLIMKHTKRHCANCARMEKTGEKFLVRTAHPLLSVDCSWCGHRLAHSLVHARTHSRTYREYGNTKFLQTCRDCKQKNLRHLKTSYFCSTGCFKRNWEAHKQLKHPSPNQQSAMHKDGNNCVPINA